MIAARRFSMPDYVRGLSDDAPESERSTLQSSRVTTVQRIAQQCQFMTFCRAKANQLFTSASRRVSTLSRWGCAAVSRKMPPTNRVCRNVLNLRILLGKIGAPDVTTMIRPADSSQSEGRRLCSSATYLYHVQDRHADPEQAAQ